MRPTSGPCSIGTRGAARVPARRAARRAARLTVRVFLAAGLLGSAIASPPALAQIAPDTGQVLAQQHGTRLEEPKADEVRLALPPAPGRVSSGGPSITLNAIKLAGVTAFEPAELVALVSGAYGQTLDYAALRQLADQIAAFYRQHGFPFVNTFVPPQTVQDGVVTIEVVEGRYGVVAARGPERLSRHAQPFLAPLKSGELIESPQLERALLLLGDQPGIKISPYVEPGRALGVGDLRVSVRPGERWGASLGVDNNGSRYTGQYRLIGGIEINGPLMFGDKLSIDGVVSDRRLWLGSAAYELPLGHDGLRLRLNYIHTEYNLGDEFASLQAFGLAHILGADIEYPIMRRQAANLRLQLGGQQKWLRNRYAAVGLSDNESSLAYHATLRFDRRDKLLGGGVFYGAASWVHGKLTLDPTLQLADALTAQKAGVFNKWTLDVARLQRLPLGFGLYNRFSGQWSDRNLESSERLSLGGADGVRAYPVGEGVGDTGWLTQSELRYGRGWLKPYAFFDIARSHANRYPWGGSSAETRFVSGYGAGVRANLHGCNLNAFLAWPGVGGTPLAAPGNFSPHWSSSLSCAL